MSHSDWSDARQFRINMESSGANILGKSFNPKKPQLSTINPGIRKRQREERAAEQEERQYKQIRQMQQIKTARDRRDVQRNDPNAFRGTMKQTPEAQEMTRQIALRAREEKSNRRALESTKTKKTTRTKPVERPGTHSTLKRGQPTLNGKPIRFRERVVSLNEPPPAIPQPGDPGFVMQLPPTTSSSPSKSSQVSQSPQPSRVAAPVLGKRKASGDPLFMNAGKRSLTYRGPMCTSVTGANTGDKMVKINPLPKIMPQTKPTTADKLNINLQGIAKGEKKSPVKKLSLTDYSKRKEGEQEGEQKGGQKGETERKESMT